MPYILGNVEHAILHNCSLYSDLYSCKKSARSEDKSGSGPGNSEYPSMK